jgi:nickel transport protein
MKSLSLYHSVFISKCITCLIFLFCYVPVDAHEVHHTISSGTAVVVQLKYADGKPFSFEAFEATPEGANTPAQVGRTDAEGRALFAPGNANRWAFKAYSSDGHGVSLVLDTPASSVTTNENTNASNRLTLILLGLSLLLGVFAIYQLWLRKK